MKQPRTGRKTWQRLALAGLVCAWLAMGVAPAQVVEKSIWPNTGSGQWFWLVPSADLAPEQVDAVFKRAVDEETAYVDTKFSATVFFAKKIRLTKGKAKDRKRYRDRPEKADDLRIEAEWRTGYLDQYRDRSYTFIALDSIRSLDLHYLPRARERFPEAPQGRNWIVNVLAASKYSFFFSLEDTARAFINAVTSALKQRGLELAFSRFGLMWENVIPAQAADMGETAGRSGRASWSRWWPSAVRGPCRHPSSGRGPRGERRQGEKLLPFFPAPGRHSFWVKSIAAPAAAPERPRRAPGAVRLGHDDGGAGPARGEGQ